MRDLAPCGTPAAYQRHVRRGEPIDDACEDAYSARHRARARARSRALNRLARRFPAEFSDLMRDELDKERRRDEC